MIPDLSRVPDPAPLPDEQVADRLDGLVSPRTSLACVSRVLARLPPEVADAIGAAYTAACRLSPDEAASYRPLTLAGLAEQLGIPRTNLRRMLVRAWADVPAWGVVRVGPATVRAGLVRPTPAPPRGEVLSTTPHRQGRNQRGATMRATNARGRARRDGSGEK